MTNRNQPDILIVGGFMAKFQTGQTVYYKNRGHQFHSLPFMVFSFTNQLDQFGVHETVYVLADYRGNKFKTFEKFISATPVFYQFNVGENVIYTPSGLIGHPNKTFKAQIKDLPDSPGKLFEIYTTEFGTVYAQSSELTPLLAATFPHSTSTQKAEVKFEFCDQKNTHEGHEIIENHAGGKTFKYCRHCKTEVF
jgi:hypothetical protein